MSLKKTLEKNCLEVFNKAWDTRDAGFILQDGTMLDFKRQREDDQWQDHWDIYKCLGVIKRDWKASEDRPELQFMNATGAMNMSHAGEHIRFSGTTTYKPTKAQARVLGPLCRQEMYCMWDVFKPDGSLCADRDSMKGMTSWGEYLRAWERCKVK